MPKKKEFYIAFFVENNKKEYLGVFYSKDAAITYIKKHFYQDYGRRMPLDDLTNLFDFLETKNKDEAYHYKIELDEINKEFNKL